ncbi:hypothetical protein P9112_004166 [Eukaryota sp. TZLM1-RC]
MRCFLWPWSVPHDLICRFGQLINLNQLFKCKFKITYRCVVHNVVTDQLYAMCKSNHSEAFVEPLVYRLSPENEDENIFGKRRANLITPRSDGVITVVDVVTIDLGRVEHVNYKLVPFAVSLFGNIGLSGIKFLEGFRSLIKERAGKQLNFNFWHNRIVFRILKAIPEILTKALLQLGIENENHALKRFDDVDAGIEDNEF